MTQAPETVQTIDEQKEWFSNYFATHILTCEKIDPETVHIKSDGFILSKEGAPAFQVKIGEVFGTPDHHTMNTYTLKQIDKDGVIITYESSFNHTSFGKNLITVDSGEIFVNYTSKD